MSNSMGPWAHGPIGLSPIPRPRHRQNVHQLRWALRGLGGVDASQHLGGPNNNGDVWSNWGGEFQKSHGNPGKIMAYAWWMMVKWWWIMLVVIMRTEWGMWSMWSPVQMEYDLEILGINIPDNRNPVSRWLFLLDISPRGCSFWALHGTSSPPHDVLDHQAPEMDKQSGDVGDVGKNGFIWVLYSP